MKFTAKQLKTDPGISIWIELERSPSKERNERSAALANKLLEKLVSPERLPPQSRFKWNDYRKVYDYGGQMGWRELSDDGMHFDLGALAGE